ncbi:hypothetical protein C6W84_2215 [Acinetobacter baumannii]|nr:hypothetical protein C6W84_2215 [Acinetobacter baumannii]
MAHAHHAAHAYVHHIKVRKEESSQGDLKTKAMLSKASSGNKKLHRPEPYRVCRRLFYLS